MKKAFSKSIKKGHLPNKILDPGEIDPPEEDKIKIMEMPEMLLSESVESPKDEDATTDRLSKMQDDIAEKIFEKKKKILAEKFGIKVSKQTSTKPHNVKMKKEKIKHNVMPTEKIVVNINPLPEEYDEKNQSKEKKELNLMSEITNINEILKEKKNKISNHRGYSEHRLGRIRPYRAFPAFMNNGNSKMLTSNANAITRAEVRDIPVEHLKKYAIKRASNMSSVGNSTYRPFNGNIYERSQYWLTERERKNEDRKKEQNDKSIEDCTFKPHFYRPGLKNLKIIKGGFHKRNNNWMAKRVSAIKKYQDENDHKEIEQCSFAPHTHFSSTIKFTEPGSFYTKNLIWKEHVEKQTAKKVPSVKRVR